MAGLGMRRRVPFDKAHGRDYRSEYDRYQGRSDQKKKRAMRNQARVEMSRKGMVRKGDGLDVDHRHPLDQGGTNDLTNLRVQPKRKNRGFKRDSKNNPI
jgi:5-methylcytosine-specific restriction endonuclease McrA